ncbi:hypothetical protein ACQPZJ_10005 [Actinoplanes sp. CA-054009]
MIGRLRLDWRARVRRWHRLRRRQGRLLLQRRLAAKPEELEAVALDEPPRAVALMLAPERIVLRRPIARQSAVTHGFRLLTGKESELLVSHDQLSRARPHKSTRRKC